MTDFGKRAGGKIACGYYKDLGKTLGDEIHGVQDMKEETLDLF
jgi:hypothetical protein